MVDLVKIDVHIVRIVKLKMIIFKNILLNYLYIIRLEI